MSDDRLRWDERYGADYDNDVDADSAYSEYLRMWDLVDSIMGAA